MLMSLEFDITVSDFENSSVIHQLTITLDTAGRYVYLVNNTADAQLLCFMISVATDSPMLPPSSGQMMTAEDMCPKECLPSKPGQSKCRCQASFIIHFESRCLLR